MSSKHSSCSNSIPPLTLVTKSDIDDRLDVQTVESRYESSPTSNKIKQYSVNSVNSNPLELTEENLHNHTINYYLCTESCINLIDWLNKSANINDYVSVNVPTIVVTSTNQTPSESLYYDPSLYYYSSCYDTSYGFDYFDNDYDYYKYSTYDPYEYQDKRNVSARHDKKRLWFRHNNVNTNEIIRRDVKYDPKIEYQSTPLCTGDCRASRLNVKYYTGRVDFDDIAGRAHLPFTKDHPKSIKRNIGNSHKLDPRGCTFCANCKKLRQLKYKKDIKRSLHEAI